MLRELELIIFESSNKNSTNQTNQTFYTDPNRDLFLRCHDTGFIVSNYVYPAIGVVGFILNLLCIIIFSNKQFFPTSTKYTMFNYLLIKSVWDCLILLLKALHPLFNCHECIFNTTYFSNIFQLLTYKYFIYVCTLCSIIFELAAQFDRLISITLPGNKRSKTFYKLTSALIITLIASFYSFKLFGYQIEYEEYDNQLYYNLYKSTFSLTRTYHILDLVHSFIRDVVCVVLLLILDIIILVIFRRIMTNKRLVIFGPQTIESRKAEAHKLENAENKTTLMILIIGVMTFIGRFPIFINYLPIRFNLKQCFEFTSETLFFVNISLQFFVYYIFNQMFKNVFKRIFCMRNIFQGEVSLAGDFKEMASENLRVNRGCKENKGLLVSECERKYYNTERSMDEGSAIMMHDFTCAKDQGN